jgi:hypothetical protein
VLGHGAPAGLYHYRSGVSRASVEVIRLVAEALCAPLRYRHVPDRFANDRSYDVGCLRLRSLGRLPGRDVVGAIARAAVAMGHALASRKCLTGQAAVAGGG